MKYPVACPTCAAAAGAECRALTSGRVTDTHAARLEAMYPPSGRRRPPCPNGHATLGPACHVCGAPV